jgi:hypothetical protein
VTILTAYDGCCDFINRTELCPCVVARVVISESAYS